VKTLADTTVLSNFAAVGRLDLLRQLHRRLYIPNEVFMEILDGLEEGYGFYTGIEDQIYHTAEEGWIELVSLGAKRNSAFSSHYHGDFTMARLPVWLSPCTGTGPSSATTSWPVRWPDPGGSRCQGRWVY
jgi:hypothetical protein